MHAPVDSDHTAAEIATLLQAPNIETDFGLDLLAADLSFRENISADLAAASVERNNYATVHGTCTLELSRKLRWGIDLVRPWMTVTDGVRQARWNEGVYCLTTPDSNVAETPRTYDVSGYDRLHLLQRQVGADYTATAGTTYRQALLDAFAAAGLPGVLIEGSAADDTLPKDKPWPLVATDEADPDQTDTPVTWLRIVNDLLRAINFRGVWCDQDGVFRCATYQEPTSRGPEFVLDADDENVTIVGEDRTVSEDVWATPNRWVFRQSNRADGAPAATEGDGIYTVVNQSDGPTSIDGRGLTWTSVIDYEAASQAKLVALGDRRVASDRRVTSKVQLTTGPLPSAGHWDVVSLIDSEMGNRKVMAASWSMDLAGGDVEWDLEVVQ